MQSLDLDSYPVFDSSFLPVCNRAWRSADSAGAQLNSVPADTDPEFASDTWTVFRQICRGASERDSLKLKNAPILELLG